MNSVLGSFAKFLISGYGTAFWCIGILLLALIVLVRLLGKLRKISQGMDEALVQVLDKKRTTVETFAREFEQFDRTMRSHALLGHQWAEFCETLIMPSSGDRMRIRNGEEAATFFNMASILEGRLNLRFYREISNYLPGLGILGTFVGLTAGIYLAVPGLQQTDPKETLKALGSLLNGASLAFGTSICGLFSSLIYSTVEKRRVHALQVSIDDWCEALDARLERVTLEQLNAEQLHQTTLQTVQLERFNTDLAISISTALDEKLAGRFAPLMDQTLAALEALRQERRDGDAKLVNELAPYLKGSLEAINALRDDRNQGNERVMQQMVRDFKDALTGSAGGEMEAVARTLQELTSELKTAAAVISGAGANAGRDFEAATQAANAQMQRSLEQMADTLAARQTESEHAAQAASRNLEEQVGKLAAVLEAAAGHAGDGLRVAAQGAGAEMREAAGAIGASIEDAIGSVQKSSAGFSSAVDRLVDVVGDGERTASLARGTFSELQQTVVALNSTLQALRQAGEPLEAAGSALTGQLRMQEKAIEALAGYSTVLRNTAANMEASSAALGESWEQVHTRYAGIDEALKKSFIEINNGVEGFGASVQGFVQQLDESFARSAHLLSGAIQELNEAVEDLSSKK